MIGVCQPKLAGVVTADPVAQVDAELALSATLDW